MVASTSETVVIIGGAIIGSSIAYFLKELKFSGRIVVIERDPTYAKSSTALSAACIRTQFGCPVNIHMSLYGAEFLCNIKKHFGPDADIGFVENGYLILGSPEVITARQNGVDMQRAEGADILKLTPDEAQRRFPWLNVDDLGIASFGQRNEGWFDAWSLLSLMRRSARANGVDYVEGHGQTITIENGRVKAVELADGKIIAADWCINAAGPNSALLMNPLGIELPVSPRKRTVFCIKGPLEGKHFPMLFDTSGAWIRAEGEGFICGIAPREEDDPDAHDDFEPHHHLLEEAVWPALAHRIPVLEHLRLERAWAGHYEVNSFDHNSIIGPHPEIPNLIFATGFSGHGVMHAPATGRGVAEHIIHGNYQTLNLSPLGYHRIKAGIPLHETVIY